MELRLFSGLRAAFDWLGNRSAALVVGKADLYGAFALIVLCIQALGCVVAAMTHVMLHGDGAYFVFAIGADDPWLIKWRDIAARAAVFVTTVAPTHWLAMNLSLTPMQTAALNGFIFYAVPLLQFAAACALVWPSHREALAFPVANYVFASLLGYGFPSEILLAPGFLWIALFAILKGRIFSVWFVLGFLGLIFSHELAAPAALIVAYLAMHQVRASPWRLSLLSAFILSAFALLIAVRLSGGGIGSDAAAIYVFDPRYVLNNATLWTAVVAVAVALLALWRLPKRTATGARVLLILAASAAPLALYALSIVSDFEQGRYDSTRTVIGAVMALLALAFVAWMTRTAPTTPAPKWVRAAPFVLAVWLAVGVGAAGVFIYDWSVALHGLRRAVISAEAVAPMPYAEARTLMAPREAAANDRMGFGWTLPYRSVVLADGHGSGRILYDSPGHPYYCAKADALTGESVLFSPAVLQQLRELACAPPPPPAETLLSRASRAIARWLGRTPSEAP